MAVAFDTSANLGALAIDGTTESITLGAGVKAVFYVVSRQGGTAAPDPTEVRWGSSSGTLFTKLNSSYYAIEASSADVWYSLNGDIPGSGAQSIWTDNTAAAHESYFISLTASTDIAFISDDADINSTSVANPSGTIGLSGNSSYVFMVWGSG